MKKSIYMLNLLLSFFTLASSVWKAEYYVILLAAPKIWMLLLLVFFFPSLSLLSVIETMSD